MVSELYLKYMKGRKKKISRGNGKGREEWEGGENKGGKGRGDRKCHLRVEVDSRSLGKWGRPISSHLP